MIKLSESIKHSIMLYFAYLCAIATGVTLIAEAFSWV